MTNDPIPVPSSPVRSVARVAAVVLALSVLAWFVHDAQERANRRAAASPVTDEQGPAPAPGELPASLSSSKALVHDPTRDFLSGSKSAVIVDEPAPRRTRRTVIRAHASSKSIVLTEPLLLQPPERSANGEKPDPAKRD